MFAVILALLLSWSAHFSFASSSLSPPNATKVHSNRNPTCDQLKYSKVNLIAVGQVNNQVVLVTSTKEQYSFKATLLTENHLNLTYSRKTLMAKGRRPNKLALQEKNSVRVNGIIVIDSKSVYLFFPGTLYANGRHQGSRGQQLVSQFQALISTSVQLQFYALRRNASSGDMQIAKMKLDGSSVTSTHNIQPMSPFYSICGLGRNAILVMRRVEDRCREKHFWPSRMAGFVNSKGQIYLFGFRRVLAFPEKAFTERGTAQKLTTNKSMSEFVQCPGDHIAGNTLFNICLTTTFCLLALIFILSCLLCCFQNGLELTRRKSQEKEMRLKQSYRSYLRSKDNPEKNHATKSLTVDQMVKSTKNGTKLYTCPVQGNQGILEQINSSESVAQTKRIISAMGIGYEETRRSSSSFDLGRSLTRLRL